MPLEFLLKNRISLTIKGYNDSDIDKWEFWRFQYIIDLIVKEQTDKENKNNFLKY